MPNSSHDVSKDSDQIKVNIKMSKPSQELPTSCKIPNFDLKDTDVLCTYKINLERKIQNMGVIKTSYLDFEHSRMISFSGEN